MRTSEPPVHRPAARIAVVVPCHNEATTIAKVIADFRASLPNSTIHVFDNNSTDGTSAIASASGAAVRRVGLQGKGNVVRRMFADVDADIYVLVDGDDTYEATNAPQMIDLLQMESLDMVVGVRVVAANSAYRRGHVIGNLALTGFLAWLFGRKCTDILSGYRVFSRRFVKSFPIFSSGFEIETELTVHALEMSMPLGEVTTPYRGRPPGSTSKLNTYRDGVQILLCMLRLYSTERPLAFYGVIGLLLSAASITLVLPIVHTYMQTGLVPRFPTAILATGMMLLGALSFFAGLILATVTRGRRELKALMYIQQRAASSGPHMDEVQVVVTKDELRVAAPSKAEALIRELKSECK